MAYVLFGLSLAKLFGIVTTFWVARTLQPADYGLWVTLLLVSSYAGIAHLGTIEAMSKEYPYLVGKGEFERAQLLEESVLASLTFSALFIMIAGFAFSALASTENSMLFLAIAFAAAASLFSSFYYQRFAAHQQFSMVSMIDTARAVLSFVFLVPCSWFWGLTGAAWGFLSCELAVCFGSLLLSVQVCGRVGVSYDLKQIAPLIRIGLPITIVWWVYLLQMSTDRLISISLLGKTATGYYGLGVSIIATLVLIPQVVGQVLYPKINDGVGKRIDPQQMALLVIMPARALSLLLPLAIGLLLVLSPYIYHQLFPKYSQGLVSGQILLCGSFFVCLIKNGANFLIATNRQLQLLRYVLATLVFNFICTIVLVKAGYGIEGIALSSSLSGALLTTLVWSRVFAGLGFGRKGRIWSLGQLYLPFLVFLLLIGSMAMVLPTFLALSGNFPAYQIVVFTVFLALIYGFLPPLKRWSVELFTLLRSSAAKNDLTAPSVEA